MNESVQNMVHEELLVCQSHLHIALYCGMFSHQLLELSISNRYGPSDDVDVSIQNMRDP